MPSLVAYGRRWAIASDDFVFPELTEAFVRLAWIFFGVVVFIFHFPLSCTTKDITFPLLILLVINGITVALALLTAAISSRGTILNDIPRKHVGTLLYIRLPVLIVEVIWTVISSIQAFESPDIDSACHFTAIIKVTIVLEWILIICVILGVIAVFNPLDEDGMEDVSMIARRAWSRRFRLFKIRQDALMRAALDDIANLLASFFQEGDVVFSDVVAGLLLVVHSPTNVNHPIKSVSPARPEWMTEKNALHFLHFATCVYGWPTYLMHNCGIRPITNLVRKLQCCGRLRCDQGTVTDLTFELRSFDDEPPIVDRSINKDDRKVLVIEDNCCFCNTAAFVLSTEIKNIDLFFVSFRNRLCEVPFVVFADHDSKSVVVTIRGSCSIMDLITDLCLDDEILSIDVDSDPVLAQDTTLDNGEVRVHRGMLRSARYVFDSLRRHRVLEDMFVLNPTYKLVVCGHSLGAGVASLLTLLLKQQYPDIQCFAFSPPGCVISEEGLAEMENHVMSVVGGDDFVSRISYQSMFRLREKVDLELRSCDKAKYEILIRGVFRMFFKSPWDVAPLSGVSGTNADRANLIAETASTATYGSAIQIDEPLDEHFQQPQSSARIQLYAPGKVLYIAKEEDSLLKEWIDPRCLSDVKLSASAITDHLPKNLSNVMEQIVHSMEEPESIIHMSV